VLGVREQASDNAQRISDIQGWQRTLNGLGNNAPNEAMIEKARDYKRSVEKEYGKLVLFFIGRDSLIDHYSETTRKILPKKRFNLSETEVGSILRSLELAKSQLTADAREAGLLPTIETPWHFLSRAEGSDTNPNEDWLLFSHQQLWVQRELLNICRSPVAPQDKEPLVSAINLVRYDIEEFRSAEDDRWAVHTLKLDLTMSESNPPRFAERLLDSGMPIEIRGCSIDRLSAGNDAALKGAGKRSKYGRAVNVKLICKVYDFTYGIDKVVFAKSNEQFATSENITAWLQQQEAQDMEVLRKQLEDLRPTLRQNVIEYEVYGSEMLSDIKECEIRPGVVVSYGTMRKINLERGL
jgi:hypothetical protein